MWSLANFWVGAVWLIELFARVLVAISCLQGQLLWLIISCCKPIVASAILLSVNATCHVGNMH